MVGRLFNVVIFVLLGVLRCSSKGLKRVSRGKSHTFSALDLFPCSLFVVILTLFVGVGCFLTRFHNKTRTFSPSRFFNFFDVHFSW